jgi:ferredoxin
VRPGFLLVVGVDCLGTFPAEDYAWRAETMAGPEGLTRQSLQFARQGGVLAYRNRLACQMCAAPTPGAGADVSIGTLGLPVRRTLLITARDAATAERLHLARITDGEALPGLVRQHEQMRAVVAGRRERARQRITQALPPGLPASVPALAEHLAACAPCRQCLDACPLYAGHLGPQAHYDPGFHDRGRGLWGFAAPSALQPDANGGAVAGLSRWLAACVECGMCEAACPRRLPLTAIFARLRREPAPQGLGPNSPALGPRAGGRPELAA